MPYHTKETEGWINHMFPVNKGNMKNFDNQKWPRGFKMRSKGITKATVDVRRLAISMGPNDIADKIINALPAPEQKALLTRQYDTKASPQLNATVALDPGERSPWVAYGVDGRVVDIGSGVMDAKIFNLLCCADRILGKMARTAAKGNCRSTADEPDHGSRS